MKGFFFYIKALGLLVVLLCCSCVSVPYLKKHQYHGNVKQLTELEYNLSNGNKILLKQSHLTFTKNGRVKYAQIFDADSNVIVTKEKKLWFVKQSFPDKEPYYCKTRWKPRNRERISCYTQKQYKQNQSIHYYHDDGSIDKIEEDFSTFNTQYYHYNIQNELIAISIKDKKGVLLDSILFKCKTKDQFNNCTALEKRYTISDSLIHIERTFDY
jgi:hypothetical protein